MSGVDRLVVGASGSLASLHALRYARVLAGSHRAPLVAVLAWTPPGGEEADRRYPSPVLRKLWEEHVAERLKGTLDQAWGEMPSDVAVSLLLFRGKAGPALVEIADQSDDLLVIGAGRGQMVSAGHGKVSRYCLAHAKCPVLAVPQAVSARQLGLGPGRWVTRHLRLTLARAEREWHATA